jgi:hypothetical protein
MGAIQDIVDEKGLLHSLLQTSARIPEQGAPPV